MNSYLRDFKKRIYRREIKVAVVGLGYVGLPLAIDFCKKGFSVLGVDVDRERINRINRHDSYITGISGQDLKNIISKNRFAVENNFHSLKEADVILICVPTPLKRKYNPDISFIKDAVKGISKNIKKNTLIILESTTYPGTTEEVILPMLERSGLEHGCDFYLCFSPERIDPGNVQYTLDKIPKVIGGITDEATHLGELIYKCIINKVVPVSSTRVAEMVKLLENTFRIVNIGLIDEIAMMAHKMNIDIWEIIEAAKTKPFGFMPFYPGPGVGGHCIPKDPLYLYWKARHHGFKPRFIKLASDIISFMPEYVTGRVVGLLKRQNKKLNKNRVLLIGVTYKKDVKDIRKAPALDIIDSFQKKNISVSYFDPLIPYLKLNRINLKSIDLNSKNLNKYDCVVIVTDHSSVDYRLILENSKVIFDTRDAYKDITDKRIVKL